MTLIIFSLFMFWSNRESCKLADKYDIETYGLGPQQNSFVGFYSSERWDQGLFRWSSRQGLIRLLHSKDTKLTLFLAHPDIKKRPVKTTVFVDDKKVDQFSVNKVGFLERCYPIYSEADHSTELRIEVSRTWEPYFFGLGNDKRQLGVAVGLVDQNVTCSM